MRILGLDYGAKTMGVAVSDPLGVTAQGVEIIRREKETHLRRTLARIEALTKEYNVGTIVLGFPKHMNNTVGERGEKSIALMEALERRTGCEVELWDERLTSVMANRVLIEERVRREQRGRYVDMLAAVFILQSYLDYQNQQKQDRS